jgi:hypothetical protein
VNDSAVLLAGDLAWPIVVLFVATVLLASQRAPLGRLIDRIKTLTYPGGGAELSAVSEGGADKIQSVVDTLSRDPLSERAERAVPREQTVGTEALELIQNREPLADFEPLEVEEVTSLVMLRTKAATLLAELAFPPPPGGFGPVSATIDVLVRRGVLDDSQAQALYDAMDIADQAARGATVPQRVAIAVKNSGPAILEQLALLRTVSAARFEDYVLSTLQKQVPASWSIDIDRAIVNDDPWDDTAFDGVPATIRHARVDALVTAGDRSVVVEVRARLQPGAYGQIDAVREWMKALPSSLPILLVMLGEGLTAHELRRISDGRKGSVDLLLWDRDASLLAMRLRDLLARNPNVSMA